MDNFSNGQFTVSSSFDVNGRFKDLSFELIGNPAATMPREQVTELKQQLLQLYRALGWKMPPKEIEATMEKAVMVTTMRSEGRLCGFFSARRYQTDGGMEFYYLERLIVSPSLRSSTIIPLAALLVFNLPGLGRESLTICAISRLRVIAALIEACGPTFFCSTKHMSCAPEAVSRAHSCLAVLAENPLTSDGILKDTFHPAFTHDGDRRLIPGSGLCEYDGAFLMNTTPATLDEMFDCVLGSPRISQSRFIHSVLSEIRNRSFFEKVQGRGE